MRVKTHRERAHWMRPSTQPEGWIRYGVGAEPSVARGRRGATWPCDGATQSVSLRTTSGLRFGRRTRSRGASAELRGLLWVRRRRRWRSRRDPRERFETSSLPRQSRRARTRNAAYRLPRQSSPATDRHTNWRKRWPLCACRIARVRATRRQDVAPRHSRSQYTAGQFAETSSGLLAIASARTQPEAGCRHGCVAPVRVTSPSGPPAANLPPAVLGRKGTCHHSPS